MSVQSLNQQYIRVSYVDSSKQVNAGSVKTEVKLRGLLAPHFRVLESVAQVPAHGCDLVIVKASHLPESHFWNWLNRLESQLGRTRVVGVPALILSDLDFSAQHFLWRQITEKNWYFDVISEDNLDSIPLRMANLVRIHDHLHETLRYQKTLTELDAEVKSLKSELEKELARKKK